MMMRANNPRGRPLHASLRNASSQSDVERKRNAQRSLPVRLELRDEQDRTADDDAAKVKNDGTHAVSQRDMDARAKRCPPRSADYSRISLRHKNLLARPTLDFNFARWAFSVRPAEFRVVCNAMCRAWHCKHCRSVFASSQSADSVASALATMDVSNRLWEQLVFSFVPVRSLLHCRATCREWRVQLDGSRLWLPFTQSLAWLRLEERLAGWHGVQQAMAREAATLRNASAGHSVVGPIMESQEPPMYVGGKYIVARDGHTFLVDAKTGATSAVAGALVTQPKQALQERFVVAESAEHGVVLDCVTGHVHTYAPALSGHDSSWRLVGERLCRACCACSLLLTLARV